MNCRRVWKIKLLHTIFERGLAKTTQNVYISAREGSLMAENTKITAIEFEHAVQRYLDEVGAGHAVELSDRDIVLVSRSDLEGYIATIELLSDKAGAKELLESIADADRLPL